MSADLMHDPRVRSTEWRDLMSLAHWEIAKELMLPLPWLALALGLAHRRWFVVALVLSFVFFLTGLRQAHDAFHGALGVGRVTLDGCLFALSVLMLGSMHAVQLTHLHHHAHCLDEDDTEAACARGGAGRALLLGPLHLPRMIAKAWTLANTRYKRWIVLELAANVVWVVLVFGAWHIAMLRYHVAVMAMGHCLTAFFAVWTVHHDCDRKCVVARTVRNWLKSIVVFNMFYHVEHHLFPQVPTCRLPRLAVRLDAVVPEIQEHRVY